MGLRSQVIWDCYNTLCHGLPLKNIKCIEAGHPVPDNAGEDAAREIYESVGALGEDDYCYV